MKNKNKESWVDATVTALIAQAVAEHTRRGTLARKHTRQIALRYALKSRSIYRRVLLRRVLIFVFISGMLLGTVIINWP